MFTENQIIEALKKLREKSPLVHNITNYVVMNNTANALLAIGASPVMAHAVEEVEDMVTISSSLVLNMGTLSEKWVDAMLLAGEKANEKSIPVVFDPVGAGATPYRIKVAKKIMNQCQLAVIRGNASEIMALVNTEVVTKGVDSTETSNVALESAKLLARNQSCVVVISGETDYITDGENTITISNGDPMMAFVTGMGCTATAIVGAFSGVEENSLLAAASAMAVMGIAGEIAVGKSSGPGSLQVNFIDTLYNLSIEEILKRLKLSE